MEWFKPGLNAEQLKKEYRKLCRQYHPDVCKEPDAEEKMKEINFQFDEYYTHQARAEFSWASAERAARQARKVRIAILVRMYWDKELGHYTTVIDDEFMPGFWLRYSTKVLGHGVDAPGEYTWEDFKGGLAYVTYEKNANEVIDEVNLKRLPAKIEPASPEEVYWYNKDHWNNTRSDRFIQATCKFGRVIFHITDDKSQFYDDPKKKYNKIYGNMLMKCSLPDAFLLGEADKKVGAEYAARSIQEVPVRLGSCGQLRDVIELSGIDFPYMVFQECTVDEFCRYHDMRLPRYSDLVPLQEIPVGFLLGDRDPIVDYLHSKKIFRVFQYTRNFKVCCGMFDQRRMEENMELMSIDDAELVQDYLDSINQNFVESAKSLLRRGKISSGIC